MNQTKMPESLWASTAIGAPDTSKLEGKLHADVVVIGGGYTGLSAALHLAEQGLDTVLLEAVEIGFGASGRNGGQIIPGLRVGPAELAQRLGSAQAERIYPATESSADLVFQLIDRHGIDCQSSRCGFIQPAATNAALKVSELRADALQRIGAPVEMLDRQTTAEKLGTNIYHGALLDNRGGALQPLSYARGLAKAAIGKGAKLYTRSPVTGVIRDGNEWIAKTPMGETRAENVLICTNGYTDSQGAGALWPGLSQSIIPVYSFQVATLPLEKKQRETILPDGHVASDSKRLLSYFRFDQEGRLLFGGRGGVNDSSDRRKFTHLITKITEIFPHLQQPEIGFHWSGRVAITTDHLPHIHSLANGVYAGLGYNGRGVAMATLLGSWLAAKVVGSEDVLPESKLKPIPFHNWRRPFVQLAQLGKGLQDRLEQL